MGNQDVRRTEPIFGLKTPVLFAHRGGVLEAPESTVRAFTYALETTRTDVLELDVQLTRDGEFVVWHGPELTNVRIEGVSNRPAARDRNRIHQYAWEELDGRAWVADPEVKGIPDAQVDLSNVPADPERCLIRFADLLVKFQGVPLNIEMKKSFKRQINTSTRKGLKDNIEAFIQILKSDPSPDRKKLVVSAVGDYIEEYRALAGDKCLTGVSPSELLALQFKDIDMSCRAFEAPHSYLASSREVIERVRRCKGSTFVFLTEFGPLLPAIDDRPEIPKEKIFYILDRGVDGIMTDRPLAVRRIMDEWIRKHP